MYRVVDRGRADVVDEAGEPKEATLSSNEILRRNSGLYGGGGGSVSIMDSYSMSLLDNDGSVVVVVVVVPGVPVVVPAVTPAM